MPDDGIYWSEHRGEPVWGKIAPGTWEAARIEAVPVVEPGVAKFIAALESTLNGGQVVYGSFLVAPASRFDWFPGAGGPMWSDIPPAAFAPVFVRHPVVRETMQGALDGCDPSLTVKFERVSPLALHGLLAAQLVEGGAMSSGRFPSRDAKALGLGFCRDLFGDRYEDVQVSYADFSWSPFFENIAWDRTWVVIDKGAQRVSMLCSTDFD